MSRELNLHKSTCQRIVEGLNERGDGRETLVRLPGVEGLSTFLAACKRHGIKPDIIEPAKAAVIQYESMLREFGGSQRQLVALLRSSASPPAPVLTAAIPAAERTPSRIEELRRDMHQACARLVGSEIGAKVVVAAIRPIADDPKRLEIYVLSCQLDIHRELFARPIVPILYARRRARRTGDSPELLTEDPPESPPFKIIPDFTTAGLKPVHLENIEGGTALVLDTESADRNSGPLDVSLLFWSKDPKDPRTDGPPRWDMAARIPEPSRALVLDVYLHEDLARLASPSIGCFSLSAAPGDTHAGDPDQLWHERFPESPELRFLQRAGLATPSEFNPRHAAMVLRTFLEAQWDPTKFVCYRSEVRFPLWQSEYRMYFHFPPRN
jgi:hypothetical protein